MNRRAEYIYGFHAVRALLQSAPDSILNVWLQDSLESASITAIRETVNALGLPIQTATRTTLDKMTQSRSHQGVLMAIRKDAAKAGHNLDEIVARNRNDRPIYLILDSVQDPHNLGACIRTAAAAGVTAVIIQKDRAVGVNDTVRKVASGAVENVTVISVVNLVRAIKTLKAAGVWVVGAAPDIGQSVYDLQYVAATAIVMGNEGKGIRPSIIKACDYMVSIPVRGEMKSLNISVATGVILYEIIRQRALH